MSAMINIYYSQKTTFATRLQIERSHSHSSFGVIVADGVKRHAENISA
jgi:hypothetical protein